VVVENHGVSGDTTAGGLARIGWALGDHVDALIVALGGNDLLRGLPPEASRANLDGILAEAEARGLPVLLIGLQAPGNYGPDYKAAFDAMYPELATEYDACCRKLPRSPDRGGGRRSGRRPCQLHAARRNPPQCGGRRADRRGLGPEVEALIARVEPQSSDLLTRGWPRGAKKNEQKN
jgi:acyl-CoA thioesterase-1